MRFSSQTPRPTIRARCLRAGFYPLLIASFLSFFLIGCTPFALPKTADSIEKQQQNLRLQILLDSENFGPGVVDGHYGEFTAKALINYRRAKGLAPDALPDISQIRPYTRYTITATDFSPLGTMASSTEEMAKQSKMPYTTLIELLSERFHTTQKFLRKLNPGKNFSSMQAGEMITVPNVKRPFRVDRYPSSYPAAGSSLAANRHVTVDINQRILTIEENGRLIASFPITPGSAEHPAPVGEWRIVGSVPWPWYRYDEGVLKRGERTETFYNLPPGPNSPVGILWAGLNRAGIGIHGTPAPDTIGRAGSHGCIRLSNWDAATFHTIAGKGTKVTIR
ncbi:L,D-transpeptidase family protein [Luteolibacter algae]|uniref:L,D-transpeptidase family protein n=1 Tax=Luteolibacter algae TaxID=454151 RepID=A0ABW5D7I9_9BACT